MAFVLTSPDVAEQQMLARTFVHSAMGAGGENLSPALSWSGAPEGTRSFALTMYDPDAPTGSGWWHWVVYDLPASCTGLPRGAGAADGKLLPAGPARATPTSAAPATAAPLRLRGTARTVTSSRCMRSRWIGSTCRRVPPRPTSAS